MTMTKFFRAASIMAAVAAGGSAGAAQLDFTINGPGDQGAQLVLPDATVDMIAGTYLTVGDFTANAVCTITTGAGCVGIFDITWNRNVRGVNFEYGFANPGDFAEITAYDAGGAVVGVRNLDLDSGTGFEDLAAIGDLRRIRFDTSTSTGAGYAFGNVNYTPVPLPAALPLFVAALAGLGLLRRRTA